MDCNESQKLMTSYIDDELDSASAIRFATHLAGCAVCTRAYEEMLELHTTIKTHGVRYTAPSHLRHRIQSALPRDVAPRHKPAKLPWAWINFGVATAFSAAFAVTLALYMAVPSEADRFEQEIVASHTRSLMANHLSDVASSDQHTVKPWFTGKLDFSPAVYDLAQQGYPLIGGRLDYLDGRSVAALAYRHHQHVMNLFVWPDKLHHDSPLQISSRQGFQLMHWTQAGMRYWAVSDMSAQDLKEFERLFVTQIEKNGLP